MQSAPESGKLQATPETDSAPWSYTSINAIQHEEKRRGRKRFKTNKQINKQTNIQYGLGLHQRFTQLWGYISKAETWRIPWHMPQNVKQRPNAWFPRIPRQWQFLISTSLSWCLPPPHASVEHFSVFLNWNSLTATSQEQMQQRAPVWKWVAYYEQLRVYKKKNPNKSLKKKKTARSSKKPLHKGTE